jgi:hypothetical protein
LLNLNGKLQALKMFKTVVPVSFARPFLALVALASCAASANRALAAEPTLLLTPFGYVDTSGEPRDQSAEHAKRLAAMESDLKTVLETKGHYRIVAAPGSAPSCPQGETECILGQARAAGAELVLAGAVQKASTMESNVWMGVFESRDGKRVFFRQATFRGDTDDAWAHAAHFLSREITENPPSAQETPSR